MEECCRFEACPLIKYCKQSNKCSSVSIKGVINLYCRGEKQYHCVRKKLLDIYGAEAVPVDMLPNGFPIPGAKTDQWPDIALNYRVII